MNDPTEFDRLAGELTDATRRGDLAGAYRLVRDLSPDDLQQISWRAGFSFLSKRDRRRAAVHLQSQIAQAARQRTDGFGLRNPNPNH